MDIPTKNKISLDEMRALPDIMNTGHSFRTFIDGAEKDDLLITGLRIKDRKLLLNTLVCDDSNEIGRLNKLHAARLFRVEMFTNTGNPLLALLIEIRGNASIVEMSLDAVSSGDRTKPLVIAFEYDVRDVSFDIMKG